MATRINALRDWVEDEGTPLARRGLVLEGPAALCAYVGVPAGHSLAEREYEQMSLECHGGLTFAGEGDGNYRPRGWYWYGWDYAHAGDVFLSDLRKGRSPWPDSHLWTVEEVEAETRQVLDQLKGLLAEAMTD